MIESTARKMAARCRRRRCNIGRIWILPAICSLDCCWLDDDDGQFFGGFIWITFVLLEYSSLICRREFVRKVVRSFMICRD